MFNRSKITIFAALLMLALMLLPTQAALVASSTTTKKLNQAFGTALNAASNKLSVTQGGNPSVGRLRHLLQRLPVYGNWCGLRYGGGRPVDAIDACCKQHDLCYGSRTYDFDCGCDAQIAGCVDAVDVSELYSAVTDPVDRAQAEAARLAIREYFEAIVAVNC